MTGFDAAAMRRLVETICEDRDVRLLTASGLVVRPVWPRRFESLPHPKTGCQAAVKVMLGDGPPFNVSLCEVTVYRPAITEPVSVAALAGERRDGRRDGFLPGPAPRRSRSTARSRAPMVGS